MNRVILTHRYANPAERAEVVAFAVAAGMRSERVLATLPNVNLIRDVTTEPFVYDQPEEDGSGIFRVVTYGSPEYLNFFQGQFGIGMRDSRWKVEKVVEINERATMASRNNENPATGMPPGPIIRRRNVSIDERHDNYGRVFNSLGNMNRARGQEPINADTANNFARRTAMAGNTLAGITKRAPVINDARLSHAFAIFQRGADGEGGGGGTPDYKNAMDAAIAAYGEADPALLTQRLVEMYVEDHAKNLFLRLETYPRELTVTAYKEKLEENREAIINDVFRKYIQIASAVMRTVKLRNAHEIAEAIFEKWAHTRRTKGGYRRTKKNKTKKRRHRIQRKNRRTH